MSDLPGAYTTYVDAGVVEVGVLFDDGTLQREVDEKHGTGVVRVSSALQPGPLPRQG